MTVRFPSWMGIVGVLVLGLMLMGVEGVASQEIRRVNTDRNGTAVDGYDPVAYFTVGDAVEGSPSITATYQGAVYQFSSREHRELFRADPDRYVPAYGGWCAYAMADGEFARIDPRAWVVYDGRLFLNFSRRINRRFTADVQGFVAAADRAWAALVGP